jgi:molybdate transport system permease protein
MKPFGLLLAGSLAVSLLFLTVPVAAIFLDTSPAELVQSLGEEGALDALRLSLICSTTSLALVVLFGTPSAWLLATRRFRGRALVITLVELPLVLPPAVAGIGLLVAFGRFGLVGKHFGLWEHVSFNALAVTFAVMLVAGPFYVRQAIAAFEAVDDNLVAASRTLGAGPLRTFFRVVLPLAWSGLAAGEAISLARGIGEFGATIMFAGSLQRRTQTLSLAVYKEFDSNFDTALAISALLVLVSFAILLTLKLVLLWRPSRPTSGFLFARSSSG